VPSQTIVINFDELKHVTPGTVSTPERTKTSTIKQQFFLGSGKEAFNRRVIMAVASSAQTALHSLIAQ
jgi:hypothetical protein